MQMLPLLEILDDCTKDAERADWLLRVPDGIVLRDYDPIRNILLTAGFRHGADFLGIRLSAVHATRGDDGELPETIRSALEMARSAMRAIAFGAPPKGGVQ